jgi:hypothetical protein
MTSHDFGCAMFLKAKFWMLVKISSPGNHLGSKLLSEGWIVRHGMISKFARKVIDTCVVSWYYNYTGLL